MPELPGASAGAGGGGVEQGKEVSLAVFWEGYDLFDGVNRPAEDNIMCAPGGVTFAELLEGDWFLPCSVSLGISPE